MEDLRGGHSDTGRLVVEIVMTTEAAMGIFNIYP